MKSLLRNRSFYSVTFSVVLSLVLVALSVQATTISTNINTGGTLLVSGGSTFQASSTVTSTLNVGALGYLGASSTAGFTGLSTNYGGLLSLASSTVGSTLLVNDQFRASSTALFSSNLFGYASSTFYGSLTVGGSATTSNQLLVSAPLYASGTAAFDNIVIGGSGNTQNDKVNGLLHGTCTVNFGTVSTTTEAYTTCTATGVTTAHQVFITPTFQQPDQYVVLTSASSSAANTIGLTAILASTTPVGTTVPSVNPAAYTWSWMAIR